MFFWCLSLWKKFLEAYHFENVFLKLVILKIFFEACQLSLKKFFWSVSLWKCFFEGCRFEMIDANEEWIFMINMYQIFACLKEWSIYQFSKIGFYSSWQVLELRNVKQFLDAFQSFWQRVLWFTEVTVNYWMIIIDVYHIWYVYIPISTIIFCPFFLRSTISKRWSEG